MRTSGQKGGINGWGPILRMIEDGVRPTGPEIAARLQSQEDIPDKVRNEIVDILENRVPRPVGPKPKKYGKDHFDRCVIALDIHLRRKHYEKEGAKDGRKGGPMYLAVQEMEDETKLSERTLRRIYYKFLKYVTD